MQYNSINYIDRDEAVEAIQKKAKRIKNADTINGLCGAISILYELPISYIKGKEGQWLHDGNKWKNRWICTKCAYKLFEERTNFCPNCGARMGK